MPRSSGFLKRIWLFLLSIGPGLFGIGYTIGTGSVTTMVKSGAEAGFNLLWHLFLCALFTWVVMEAYGRYAAVTGKTVIRSFRTLLPLGNLLALLVMSGIIVAQWSSYAGIVGICSNGIYETIRLFLPSLRENNYGAVLAIAAGILLCLYLLLLVGRYSFFEKILIVFVTLMGICFLLTMFIVLPDPRQIAAGFLPRLPPGQGGELLFAALAGTTMAGPTFVVRPLTIRGHGWGRDNLQDQSRDAWISALLVFLISASIMICAATLLHQQGRTVERVLDMVATLEPLAGKFAVSLFLVGLISAGLSSTFPIMMVGALLIADYRKGELDTRSRLFRLLAAVACLFGLTVPVLGAQPIAAQIITQIANVFVLPLVILGVFFLVNRSDLMGAHRAGLWLNAGLAGAFFFACLVSYRGAVALSAFFSTGG